MWDILTTTQLFSDMLMPKTSLQAPSSVVMIRPHHFTPNAQTAVDNHFQKAPADQSLSDFARAAFEEVTRVAERLQAAGVDVHVFEDEGTSTPDSVFPNNWFSTHSGGHVAVYPMHSENRRAERRQDLLDMLKRNYRVQDIIDYSGLEQDDLFLEGTGAMVIDHLERVAYAARSKRTSEILLERFCTHFNYEPVVFDAVDRNGALIYHTNVLMCIGTGFAMIGLETIADYTRRSEVAERLRGGERDIVDLTHDQITEFAGNAIELQCKDGLVVALSARALASLRSDQRRVIERQARLLPLEIPTIEHAGGSLRCMIAGLHLSRRPEPTSDGVAA